MSTPPLTVADWVTLEDELSVDRYAGTAPPGSVRLLPGPLPVLLTAPHAVSHTRFGARKGPDVATGGLALLAGRAAGAPTLIATGHQDRDGNHAAGGPFKDAARALYPQVRAAVDLHGFPDGHAGQVCLGTGATPPQPNPLLELAVDVFTGAGFTVSIDDPFGAKNPYSLTSIGQRHHLPSLQVEVARAFRRPWEDPAAGLRAVAAVAELLRRAAAELA